MRLFVVAGVVFTVLSVGVLVFASSEESDARVEAERAMTEIVRDRGQTATDMMCDPLRIDDTWLCDFSTEQAGECEARLKLDDEPNADRFCAAFGRS